MLPEKFKERMKRLLGDEYGAFERALTSEDAVRGFRINRTKVKNTHEIETLYAKMRIPYEADGYVLKDGISIGRTAAHHSGAVYMQDPGAMAALAALPKIEKGIWAIDLCAAPGGKTSKISELIGDNGLLISNEYVPKRAKILVGNVERLGLRNTLVTSLDTSEFKKLFDGAFGLVVADVPCSGEGMFRKNPDAISEWSEENVAMSAKRQREILENAAPLVKEGGILVYSTCTFSTEENEENVRDFLQRHGEFELFPVNDALIEFTSPGIDVTGKFPEIGHCARRFYPHVSGGEGQFVALMQRKKTGAVQKGVIFKESITNLTKSDESTVKSFFKENLTEIPKGRLAKQGENVVLIPHGGVLVPKSVFCAGVLIGEIRKGILFPSHQFFSAYGAEFKNKIKLKTDDPALEKYLRGEEIDIVPDVRGWCAVIADGSPLGGGKASGGKLKNHYPKGLRNAN